jgi:hypothetical protein
MADARPPMTEGERYQLRSFVRVVYEMDHSRFMAEVRRQRQSMHWEQTDDEGGVLTTPDYDWEDFRSFLLSFRQVAVSDREDVYLPKVRKCIGKFASDRARAELAKMKPIVMLVEGRYSGVQLVSEVPGEEMSLTTYQMLEALVNGQLFHSDPRHKAALNLLDSSPREMLIFWLMLEVVRPVFNACVFLFKVIRSEGLLPAADIPAPARAEK